MRIKAEYKDRVITWTSSMGVPMSKKLGDLTKSDKNLLKYMGYNFEGLVEEPKPRKKKEDKPTEEDGV